MYDRSSNYDRIDAAMSFLKTGSTKGNPQLNIGSSTDSGRVGCQRSSDCAVGWTCSGGYCKPPATSANTPSGSTDGCGLDTPSEAPEFSCNDGAGGAGGCDQPGCGGNSGIPSAEDCCGSRCCRFFGTGTSIGVQCFCGDCPPKQRCQTDCDDYKKFHGSTLPGCEGENTECSECQSCNPYQYWAFCDPNPNPPCHCEGGECRDCEKCNTETGSCEESCESCQTVYTMYNQQCCCGTFTLRCFVDACGSSPAGYNQCLEAGCKKACPDCGKEKDCTPIIEESTTVYGTTSQVVGEDLVCPAGFDWSGTIDVEGTRAIICQKERLPEGCEDLECLCHADCAPCELCGDNNTVDPGRCIPIEPGGTPACCPRCIYRVFFPQFGGSLSAPYVAYHEPIKLEGPLDCKPFPSSPDVTVCTWKVCRWVDCDRRVEGNYQCSIESLSVIAGLTPYIEEVTGCYNEDGT